MLTKNAIYIMAYLSDHKRVLFMRESTQGISEGQTTANAVESDRST